MISTIEVLFACCLFVGSTVPTESAVFVEGEVAAITKYLDVMKAQQAESRLKGLFRRDPFCGLFSSKSNRAQGCTLIFNSPETQKALENWVLSTSDLDEQSKSKCSEFAVPLVSKQSPFDVNAKKANIKMFTCPVTGKNAIKQTIRVSLGNDGKTYFLFRSDSGYVTFFGWFDPQTTNAKSTPENKRP